MAGLVLDQLHERVLIDDLSGRDREVLTDLELARVGLADLELPAPALDVLRQQLHAANQVLAVRSERFPQEFRVGEHPVRRGDRVDDLLRVEPRLLLGLGIKSLRFADQVLCPVGCNQIRLPHQVEQSVFRPGRILETTVFRRPKLPSPPPMPIAWSMAELQRSAYDCQSFVWASNMVPGCVSHAC